MLDKDEVKEAIVNVARHIFSRFGFRKTTMDEIAIASRKGEKEALIMKQELINAKKETDSPAEKLKIHVLVRMRTMEKLANFYSAIKDDYLSHLEFIEKIRRKYDQEEIQMMETILVEGVENGMFEIEDTSLAAIAIVTALKGMEIPLFWGVEEKDVERRLDQLIHVLFHGVMKR